MKTHTKQNINNSCKIGYLISMFAISREIIFKDTKFRKLVPAKEE